MPKEYKNKQISDIQEDEIDLRELFGTILRYKWSIITITFLVTAIVAVVAYRMPKYYKTTTLIEVKPKDQKSSGISLGDAGALLGLAGIGGGENSVAKDATLLKTFRTNEKALQEVDYSVTYWYRHNFRDLELGEDNRSIDITDLHIPNYRNYGMKIVIKPTSDTEFEIIKPSLFGGKSLGKYSYNKPIRTAYFSMTVNKKNIKAPLPSSILLHGDKHHIYDSIISKNLTVEPDKKAPFLKISYLDRLPKRGEAYLKATINAYIYQSIYDEKEDADITLSSLKDQIREIEDRVAQSSRLLKEYKTEKGIVAPDAQVELLVKERAKSEIDLVKNNYKQALVAKLIKSIKNGQDASTIGSSLAEVEDEATLGLIEKLQMLQLEKIKLTSIAQPTNPALVSTKKQITALRSKILSNLNNLKITLSDRNDALKKLKSDYDKRLSYIPAAEQELIFITRTYKLNESIYTYLLQKKSSAQIQKAEAMSRFRTIEPIYTNPAPAKPKKTLIVIVGFITALILSIFLAFFREFLREGKAR